MLNNISLMGRLTRDPELHRTASGVAVTTFSLAVERDFATQNGERETDFIDCVAWRQVGEFVAKYFSRGQLCGVTGRLQIRTWTDKDGNKRRNAEVLVDNIYFAGENRSANATPSPNVSPIPEYGDGYTSEGEEEMLSY